MLFVSLCPPSIHSSWKAGRLANKNRKLQKSRGFWYHFSVLCQSSHSFKFFLFIRVCCSLLSNFLLPHELQPARLFCPWNSPGKNIGVGCHFLPPTQGLNPGLLHCRQIFYSLSYWENPIVEAKKKGENQYVSSQRVQGKGKGLDCCSFFPLPLSVAW